VSATRDFGPNDELAWSFTYATRLAWSPPSAFPLTWSIVRESTGAEGEGTAKPEYRIGPRWEPTIHAVFALTYEDEFNGHHGACWELGMMLFTLPFFGHGVAQ
jgi:hypothetical protein